MVVENLRSRAVYLASASNTPAGSIEIASSAPATEKREVDLIAIKLKAFDHRELDSVASGLIDIVRRSGSVAKGPIPLPNRIEKFTVNRSPHGDKKSREQFEIRTHKRLIHIVDPSARTIDTLIRIDIPSMVDVEIELGTTRIRDTRNIDFAA